MANGYVLDAELVDWPGVSRRLALHGDDTLEDLHEVLQEAFDWQDGAAYSFRPEHDHDTPLDKLGLEPGQQMGYVLDFGERWEVELTVAEVEPVAMRQPPRVLESVGEAPPVVELVEDEEIGTGD